MVNIYEAQDSKDLPLEFNVVFYSDPSDPSAVAICM